jgi:hypothetical protein
MWTTPISECTSGNGYTRLRPTARYCPARTLQDRADIPHTHFRNGDPQRPLRFLTIYVLERGRSYTMEP